MLNDDALALLKGYKALVQRKDGVVGKQEIHIIITGQSRKYAKKLFDELQAMEPNEVKGV